jgi:Arc/MetJ-type ribon-helix-helix transcriptional regulator
MRTTVSITLPPALREWVQSQIAVRGFETPSELIRDMIRREREKTLRFQVDKRLEEALQTPVSAMIDQDWDDIRRRGRKLATRKRA